MAATPVEVVIAPLVPVSDPVVAVMVCAVPAAVLLVNVTVAIPLVLVVLVAAEKDPPPVLDQVTTCPLVVTELLLPSASCALMVTDAPAIGDVLVDVTMYFVAAAAAKVTSALFAIAREFTVPVTVEVAALVPLVSTATYRPALESPTALRVPAVRDSATVDPPNAMLLPFASLS